VRSFASTTLTAAWDISVPLHGKEPRDLSRSSRSPVSLKCTTCQHQFMSTPHRVTAGTGCPYCGGTLLCTQVECSYCWRRSFASRASALQLSAWHPSNVRTPRELHIFSHTQVKFTCAECHLVFQSKLANVSAGTWCPHCKHKTERKLYRWLLEHTQLPVIREWSPVWCSTAYIYFDRKGQQYREGRYQYRFDFLVNGTTVIELDGPQHLRHINKHWLPPLCQQIRDRYKERKARTHSIHVIRLLQTDVWHDVGDWRGDLERRLRMHTV
jgi:DNA-directed RNA polymerase subunit RPC12/RpoP